MTIKGGRHDLTLRAVPEDVFEILITEQTRIKLEKRTFKFGLDQVVYKLVRMLSKLLAMPRREYDLEHMLLFGRYIAEHWRSNESPSRQMLEHLLSEWKRDRPGEFQEDKTMVILLGKTPGDILGLKGPKQVDPPSGN